MEKSCHRKCRSCLRNIFDVRTGDSTTDDTRVAEGSWIYDCCLRILHYDTWFDHLVRHIEDKVETS